MRFELLLLRGEQRANTPYFLNPYDISAQILLQKKRLTFRGVSLPAPGTYDF